jgi:hypothetical protein
MKILSYFIQLFFITISFASESVLKEGGFVVVNLWPPSNTSAQVGVKIGNLLRDSAEVTSHAVKHSMPGSSFPFSQKSSRLYEKLNENGNKEREIDELFLKTGHASLTFFERNSIIQYISIIEDPDRGYQLKGSTPQGDFELLVKRPKHTIILYALDHKKMIKWWDNHKDEVLCCYEANPSHYKFKLIAEILKAGINDNSFQKSSEEKTLNISENITDSFSLKRAYSTAFLTSIFACYFFTKTNILYDISGQFPTVSSTSIDWVMAVPFVMILSFLSGFSEKMMNCCREKELVSINFNYEYFERLCKENAKTVPDRDFEVNNKMEALKIFAPLPSQRQNIRPFIQSNINSGW